MPPDEMGEDWQLVYQQLHFDVTLRRSPGTRGLGGRVAMLHLHRQRSTVKHSKHHRHNIIEETYLIVPKSRVFAHICIVSIRYTQTSHPDQTCLCSIHPMQRTPCCAAATAICASVISTIGLSLHMCVCAQIDHWPRQLSCPDLALHSLYVHSDSSSCYRLRTAAHADSGESTKLAQSHPMSKYPSAVNQISLSCVLANTRMFFSILQCLAAVIKSHTDTQHPSPHRPFHE